MLETYANIWVVMLAALVATAINVVWYSRWLFGDAWRQANGSTHLSTPHSWQDYLAILGINVFTAYVLSQFVQFAIIALKLEGTITDGVIVGMWAWLGFVAAPTLINSVRHRQKREVWIIESSQYLLSLLVMGAFVRL